MMRLAAKLDMWAEKNLISAEQKNQILEFEGQNSGNRWISALVCFAAFLVGLGLIAVVAENWQEIPNAVKLCSAVVLMCVNAGAVFWAKTNNRDLVTQVLTVVFSFLLMAVIGLTGQVYHLRSDYGAACLAWSVISFPLMFLMPRLIWLWLPVMLAGIEFKLDTVWAYEKTIFYVLMGRTLLLVTIYEILVGVKKLADSAIVSALRVYSGLSFFGMYVFSYIFERFDYVLPAQQFAGVFALAAAGVYALNFWRKRVSFMPLFLLGVVVPVYWSFSILPTLLLCAVLCGYCYYHKMPRLFNAAVLLMVIRILAYYLLVSQLFAAGLNLIVSGVILLMAIHFLRKYSAKLWERK